MNEDIKYFIMLIAICAIIFAIGYVCGYAHVIATAQAWMTDVEDLVAMTIDGRVYHYYVMQL